LNNQITFENTIKELEKLPSRENQSTNQRKLFSEISVALLTRHLEHLIDERNWVTGIIMSASMLEFAGKTRLLWKQTWASKTQIRKIHELDFATAIEQLLKCKMIDKPVYEKMEEIRHVRNKAAHDLPYQAALSLENRPNDTLEGYIRRTIEIIQVLFSSTY